MEILGLATARSGSKCIPGKNVKLLAGKPLIRWTIDEARKSWLISRLLVSTDDEEIRSQGRLENFLQSDLAYLRRQDLQPAYVINGAIYINKPLSLCRERKLILEGALAYNMPKERSLDVDTP